MLVLVLTACPNGLRGFLTRWLLEVSAGVFVGVVSKRVRERVWERTLEMMSTGRAIMVAAAKNEQGLEFFVHGHHWEPVDIDGIVLMLRPSHDERPTPGAAAVQPPSSPPQRGWSRAARGRAGWGR